MNSKIKKIAPGYYEFEYQGKNVEISRENLDGEVVWYWEIDGEGGHDYFRTKRDAVKAALMYIG
tara:strand:- start:22137 stop:22328 length:192 start_codon:yes stop_codon:yes gene_type:complete